MERDKLLEHVRRFPDRPGVYLMHDSNGGILYVGKAKSLKKRVSSYFRHVNFASPRLRKLVSEITDISTIRTETEVEALILESKLIKLYQPFFNVELKMGDRYPYLRITHEKFPRIVITRHRLEDGSIYLGPYTRVSDLRELLRLIERYFPLRTCSAPMDHPPTRKRPCMQYALGRCMAPCTEECTQAEYRDRVTDVLLLLQGKGLDLVERLRKRMDGAANELRFEDAAHIRDTIKSLWRVSRHRQTTPSLPGVGEDLWGPLTKLQELLQLPTVPWRIDGFDISHTAGRQTVGVVVVFEQGVANPSLYRRFNIRDVEGIDDFRSMKETILRRYKRSLEGQDPLPQLILVDGGPIQLEFAQEALRELSLSIPIIALAERFEEVYIPNQKRPLLLYASDTSLRLLQRIRDESHRFAITSHRKWRGASYKQSRLEEVPGIGRNKATLLLSRFGSLRNIEALERDELAKVPGIGSALASRILEKLKEESI